MTRAERLGAMRVAGYHGDWKTWVRAYLDGRGSNRVSFEAAKRARREGEQARANGMACGCGECAETRAS